MPDDEIAPFTASQTVTPRLSLLTGLPCGYSIGRMDMPLPGSRSVAGSDRVKRPLALACAAVVLLVALGVWISSLAPADGPLMDVHGDGVGAHVTAGVPFTYSGIPLQNVGSQPIVLLSARMGPHTPGLHMIGVGIARHFAGYVLDNRGYPRLLSPGHHPGPRPTMVPLTGVTIPGGPYYYPRNNLVPLIVGFRVDQPGDFELRGMVVTYEVGRATYTERIGPTMAVCAPAGHKACNPPDNVPW
jgi:hypothetical protein